MKVRYFIPAILLLALIAFLAVLLNLQYFNITEMVFAGNVIYPDSQLIRDTNIKTNENGFKQLFEQGGEIYMFRFTKEEEHLMNSLPYIKDISIKYQLPNTVIFNIEERTPVFYTKYLATFLVLDKDGTVLDVLDQKPVDGLILLSGLSFTTFKTGERLDLDDTSRLDAAYLTYTSINKTDAKETYSQKLLPLIKEISFADKKNMHINIDGNVVSIIPTDDNVQYNVNSMHEIYIKNIINKGKGVLDFTGSNPIFTPYTPEQNLPNGT